jgi:hypothetical protein
MKRNSEENPPFAYWTKKVTQIGESFPRFPVGIVPFF